MHTGLGRTDTLTKSARQLHVHQRGRRQDVWDVGWDGKQLPREIPECYVRANETHAGVLGVVASCSLVPSPISIATTATESQMTTRSVRKRWHAHAGLAVLWGDGSVLQPQVEH